MTLQAISTCEAPTTFRTLEWLFPSVGTLMGLEMRVPLETLGAERAVVAFYSFVFLLHLIIGIRGAHVRWSGYNHSHCWKITVLNINVLLLYLIHLSGFFNVMLSDKVLIEVAMPCIVSLVTFHWESLHSLISHNDGVGFNLIAVTLLIIR